MRSNTVNSLVCILAVISITLTFFHPLIWLPVGLCLCAAFLSVTVTTMTAAQFEPPASILVLIWLVLTILLALAYGATEQFYNSPQIALVVLGSVLGYFISVTRTSSWVAWTPFILFAAYFASMMLLGRDASEVLTRNSRNFISVIMLGLYASAALLSKPSKVSTMHLIMAIFTLIFAIWATGRGGILTAFLLNAGLIAHVLLRGKMGIVHTISILFVILVLGVAIYAGFYALLNQGYLTRLIDRGLQDAPRLAMIAAYFQGIQPIELLFGKNYYDNSYLARYEFNLHNSYLSAWAHLGLSYFLLILGTLAIAIRRLRTQPVIVIALLALAVRAITDTQMIAAKYDYVFIAALFILIRQSASRRQLSVRPSPPPVLEQHMSAQSHFSTTLDASKT